MPPQLAVSELDVSPGQRDGPLKALSNLPAFRPAAVKALSLSSEADDAVHQFEQLYRSDPSMSAELLLRANSAAFGRRYRVETIKGAITLLGCEYSRAVACSMALRQCMGSLQQSPAALAMWSHSIATGIVAEQLGSTIASLQPLLYTAGLLHDLGRVGLLQMSPGQYEQHLATEFESVDEALKVESILMGITHVDAGAHLAKIWNFPDSICEGIRHHHAADLKGKGLLANMTQRACHIATALGYHEVLLTGMREAKEPRNLAGTGLSSAQAEKLIAMIGKSLEL